jgi:ABC-2 type transport system permease protein
MLTLTVANLKMMARNRHTTLWSLVFPLMLVVVFGLFSSFGGSRPSLAVVDQARTPLSVSLYEQLLTIDFLTTEALGFEKLGAPAVYEQLPAVAVLTRESGSPFERAQSRIESGTLDYLLVIPAEFGAGGLASPTLTYRSNNPERNQLVTAAISGIILSKITGESQSGEESPSALVTSEIAVPSVSFFDTALLGLLSLGIMTSSIISVAVKISTYRGQSILKRMLVTPLAIWKYFAAEITAHLLLALVQAAIILGVGVFVFGAQIPGNLAWIFIIVLLGSLVFLNLGFILSAWANTPSAASGMGNVIALPMLFFAGAFFSTTSLPWILPYVAEALPLTPLLTALREVAIYDAPLWQVWPQLAALGGWIAGTAVVAIKVFRFS